MQTVQLLTKPACSLPNLTPQAKKKAVNIIPNQVLIYGPEGNLLQWEQTAGNHEMLITLVEVRHTKQIGFQMMCNTNKAEELP